MFNRTLRRHVLLQPHTRPPPSKKRCNDDHCESNSKCDMHNISSLPKGLKDPSGVNRQISCCITPVLPLLLISSLSADGISLDIPHLGNFSNIRVIGFRDCPAGRAHCAWGGRSHAFLTCLGSTKSKGPPAGRDHASAEQREAPCSSSLRDKTDPPRSGRPTRSGPVRQDSL